MDSRNLILVDMPVDADWGLWKGIEVTSGEKWNILYREGRLSVPRYKRILNYIGFPLSVLLRKRADKIVAWQQFYGLMYVFYNRIFRMNRTVRVTAMTFIYKERRGFLGKLYKAFINYALGSPNLRNVIVYSRNEVDFYASCFPEHKEKFKFFPLGIAVTQEMPRPDDSLRNRDYIFTAGRSNRDYEFLVSSLKGTRFNVKIACDGLDIGHEGNIEILHGTHDQKMLEYMYNSKLVVIPLKDLEISSGQLVILQAMRMGKPLIVTNNKGVYDYVENGETGFIIENKREDLLEKLNLLYGDTELYDRMSGAETETFKERYSIYALGKNIGRIA